MIEAQNLIALQQQENKVLEPEDLYTVRRGIAADIVEVEEMDQNSG